MGSKAYVFSKEKFKKVFDLLKENNLLRSETFITRDDSDDWGDWVYQVDNEEEETGEYETTKQGILIAYDVKSDCGCDEAIDECSKLFLTEDGVMLLQSPGFNYGTGDSRTDETYFRGFVGPEDVESKTSISDILDVIRWETHNIPKEIIDKIEEILKP